MDRHKKFSSWLFILIFILLSVYVFSFSTENETYFYIYDKFNDGVIDTDLWAVSGPVAEYDRKMVLSTEGIITTLKKNLIGMWFSVRGSQNIGVGEHVNIHLATQTPASDIVIVGEYIDIDPPVNPDDPPFINKYVFCQWYEDGIIDQQHLHHVDLEEAQWGVTYIFGLEYTREGSILVWVNGQIVYSFSVPGVDLAYSQEGAPFWFIADSVEGGDVTAKIGWAKAEAVKKVVLLIHGIWGDKDDWGKWGVKQLLEENGYLTDPINFCPSNGNVENEAIRIGEEITYLLTEYSGSTVDIVAHSMGGLAARWYLTHPELWPIDEYGNPKHGVRKFIMLGTPNLGTDIHLLHPIAANFFEYKNKDRNGCTNIYYESEPYNFNIWSPALQEMTARWKPPAKWSRKEPMKNSERNLPYAMMTVDPTPYEWWKLNELFPPVPDTRTCFINHRNYYKSMIDTLTGGRNLSPFLEELNAAASPGDIEYYLFYGLNRDIRIFKGDYGDGIVHQKSASGKGLSFPNAIRVPVPEGNHINLPAKSKLKILLYLNE